MTMRSLLLTGLVALTPLTTAYPHFTNPIAGSSLSQNTITAEWEDIGFPKLEELDTYNLYLCAGGNTDGSYVEIHNLVEDGKHAAGQSTSAIDIPKDVGEHIQNGYFLKMVSLPKSGGTVTSFSSRFSLPSMSSAFRLTHPHLSLKRSITSATTSTLSGPDPILDMYVAKRGDNEKRVTAAAAAAEQYDVTFTAQTGSTKWAPMAPVPGTTITKKTASAQFPTSAVTYAVTYMGSPTIATTITQTQTWSVSSVENPATAASQPSDSANSKMKRWLERWTDDEDEA